MNAWWRAANYLSVGQIYLLDNPLLREPLRLEHVKPRLLGHWGTTPGLNFVYAHLNRVIRAQRPRRASSSPGPGTAGPGLVASTYLEGTYSEVYPDIRATRRACAGCSGSSPSPAASPATSRRRRRARSTRAASSATRSSHAYGAAFDNPDLLVVLRRRRRRGRDRPAGGQLALQQVPRSRARRRRAADPAPQRLQDRQPDRAGAHPAGRAARAARRLRPRALLRRGRRPRGMHQLMAETLDQVVERHRRHPGARARRATPSGRAGR